MKNKAILTGCISISLSAFVIVFLSYKTPLSIGIILFFLLAFSVPVMVLVWDVLTGNLNLYQHMGLSLLWVILCVFLMRFFIKDILFFYPL